MSLDNIAVGREEEGSLAARPQPSKVLHQLIDIVDKRRKLLCAPNREPSPVRAFPMVGERPPLGRKRTPDRHVENAEFGKGGAAPSLAAADHRRPPPTPAPAERADGEAM